MVTVERPPANGFVRVMRKVYNPIGFSKGYNFILWFIFDGALLGFALSRLPYLSFNGIYCHESTSSSRLHAAPGDCYWYQSFRRYNIGIIVHLATILPAALLVVFQFVPVIRHKFLLYHRIAGYVIILLALVSNGSALAIANRAMNGDGSTRMAVGSLVLLTTGSLFLAYWNIKKLQIDQHRAWMLRAWFYFASIITLRLVQVIAATIAAASPEPALYVAYDCAEVVSIFNGATAGAYAHYPLCMPNNTLLLNSSHGVVPALAKFGSPDPVEIAAALDSWFGAAAWLALLIHAVGVEVYLHLTPREGQRLRQVSYERQLERGWKDAGFAGLVHDRLGDSEPWVPAVEKARGGSGSGSGASA